MPNRSIPVSRGVETDSFPLDATAWAAHETRSEAIGSYCTSIIDSVCAPGDFDGR